MIRLFAAAAFLVIGAGCVTLSQAKVAGSGDVTRSARSVGPFKSIVLEGAADLRISAGQPESVFVQAQPNIAELIETNVAGGTLTISRKESYSTDKGVLITVTVPNLDALSVRGESNATISGLREGALSLKIDGAGNVDASGSVGHLTLDSEGAGNAGLGDLAARDAVVRLGGVGNARISVSQTLDVEINGIGSVAYRGSPRIVRQEIHGIGRLSKD